MRKYLLPVALAAAIASPALARDNSPYLGVEGGILFPHTTHVDGRISDGPTTIIGKDLFGIKYKNGYDLDLIGGYDFGKFRLEGEAGYKRAGLKRLSVPNGTLRTISDALRTPVTSDDLRVDGHARAFSGMLNGLADFGGANFGAYAGVGAGVADVKLSSSEVSASKSKFAWQVLAGVQTQVSKNIDMGLKYRYFRTSKLRFSDQIATSERIYTASLAGRFSSHSLLASAVYNFRSSDGVVPTLGAAYAPSPPPPVTNVQTCQDGSVVSLATACPYTYSPPPPAPPPPSYRSRGERG